jgi:hypothetical protein
MPVHNEAWDILAKIMGLDSMLVLEMPMVEWSTRHIN